MQRFHRFLNKLYEPTAGIIGGNYTAKEVIKSGWEWHSLFCVENINYLIIGTIGAVLFGIAAYITRLVMDFIFKRGNEKTRS